MAQGLGCTAIARALGISALTVRQHRKNMLGKTALPNASALLAHARRVGWIPHPPPRPTAALTPRERQVLALVVEGHSSKQIARRLGISHYTVHKHRENLMRKLGATSTAQLAAWHGDAV